PRFRGAAGLKSWRSILSRVVNGGRSGGPRDGRQHGLAARAVGRMRFGSHELFPRERFVCPGGDRLGIEARAVRHRSRTRLQRLPEQALDRSIAIGVALQALGPLSLVLGAWCLVRSWSLVRPQSPVPSPQSPVPNPQSPVPSPQFPVANPQSPVPSPQSPIPSC